MSNEQDNPLVSVVIPTYKRPDMLGRAIDSVLNQTYDNIEIIVVDDNDEDSEYRKETEGFMKKYANIDNLFYLKHKENKGGSAARNTGIRNSKGDFVAFLDDDDEWLEEKIEIQLNLMIQNNALIASCDFKMIDDNNNLIGESKKRNRYDLKDLLWANLVGSTSLIIIKSKIASKILFDEDLTAAQDYDFYVRCLKLTNYIYVANQSLVKINIHSGERISTSGNNKYRGNKNFILKHYNIMNKKTKKFQLFKYRLLEWKMNKRRNYKFFLKGLSFYPWWKSVEEVKRVLSSIKLRFIKL